MGHLQLARELRVEVALGGGPRLPCGSFAGLQFPHRVLERRSFRPHPLDRPAVPGDALFVDPDERGDRTDCASEFTDAADTEQQLRVARAPAFVDVDEMRLEVRKLGDSRLLQTGNPIRRLLNGEQRSSHGSVRLLQALRLQVSLDLKSPQVAQERAGLPRELIGFPLECADPVVDPARQGLRAAASGLLRAQRGSGE